MTEKPEPGCQIVYPTIAVPSVVETIEFYQQQLDFELQFVWGEPPVHAGLFFGNGVIHFNQHKSDLEQVAQGFWLYFQVEDVDLLFNRYREKSDLNLTEEPVDQPWGMREFGVKDLNGLTLRFGQEDLKSGEPVPVERVDLNARMEKRLAGLLVDLAAHKQMTIGETLEEALLHSFEAAPDMEGQAVASPHTRRTMTYIEELKKQHGIDYETHDAYRFTEK